MQRIIGAQTVPAMCVAPGFQAANDAGGPTRLRRRRDRHHRSDPRCWEAHATDAVEPAGPTVTLSVVEGPGSGAQVSIFGADGSRHRGPHRGLPTRGVEEPVSAARVHVATVCLTSIRDNSVHDLGSLNGTSCQRRGNMGAGCRDKPPRKGPGWRSGNAICATGTGSRWATRYCRSESRATPTDTGRRRGAARSVRCAARPLAEGSAPAPRRARCPTGLQTRSPGTIDAVLRRLLAAELGLPRPAATTSSKARRRRVRRVVVPRAPSGFRELVAVEDAVSARVRGRRAITGGEIPA